jgi:hypothetical protein
MLTATSLSSTRTNTTTGDFSWDHEDSSLFPFNPLMNRRVTPLDILGKLTPEEICPICTDTVSMELYVLSCCGNIMCFQCHLRLSRHCNQSQIQLLCPLCRSKRLPSALDFPRLITFAEAGKSWAHQVLGNRYAVGKPRVDYDANADKALYHALEAHRLGDYRGTWRVARLYIFGMPGRMDICDRATGVEYLLVAALQGKIAEALLCLGQCYRFGELAFPCCLKKARHYYEEAASYGSLEAIDVLVPLYQAEAEDAGPSHHQKLTQMETYVKEYNAILPRYYLQIKEEMAKLSLYEC